jgi:hypothetical protein
MGENDGLPAWWSTDDSGEHAGPHQELRVTDERDWRNQIHGGERIIHHGLIFPPPSSSETEEAVHG